jgi:hypothetical protein
MRTQFAQRFSRFNRRERIGMTKTFERLGGGHGPALTRDQSDATVFVGCAR